MSSTKTPAQPVELLGGFKSPGDVLEGLREAVVRSEAGKEVWQYFDRRVKTHNEAVGLPVGQPLPRMEGSAKLLQSLSGESHGKRRMIYVHIPFCATICSFCAFFRQPGTSSDIDPFVTALLRQIERFSAADANPESEIDAIYFGGGTPTILTADQFSDILAAIRRGFRLTSDCEISVESRVHGVDTEYLKTLAGAGVNRISFGVQSFNTQVRRHVGRIAAQEEVLKTLSDASAAGIPSVTVDLIYNLPRQSMEVWENDLSCFSRSSATGASVYSLIPFKRSVLAQRMADGKEEALGGVDEEFRYYSMADEALGGRSNWHRCSPVHFGRDGVETNRYNSRRSAPIDIFGFGAGGGGRIGNILYMNPVHVGHYIEDQTNDCDAHVFAIDMVPLYRDAMNCFSLTDNFLLDENEIPPSVPTVREVLANLVKSGLANKDTNGWELTRDGRFWAYNVSSAIAEAIRCDLSTTNPYGERL